MLFVYHFFLLVLFCRISITKCTFRLPRYTIYLFDSTFLLHSLQ